MISRELTDDLFLLEFDEACDAPRSKSKVLSHLKVDFSQAKYFSWQATFRHDDPQEVTIDFGQGTLSPFQNTALLLRKASELTGGYVKLSPKFHFCPVLVGHEHEIVPLFRFVEVLDELIDYEQIREELPSLSFAQIHGSFAFLRKVAQFNMGDQDIDDLEDEYLVKDPKFIDELRQALADQEKTRVLDFSERNNERAT